MRWVRRAAVVVAVGGWCGWASAFHRSTWPARVTWLVSLAAVAAVAVLVHRGRHRRHPSLRVRAVGDPWPPADRASRGDVLVGTSPWLALVVVAVAWDVLGLDTGTHQPHLTISALSQSYRPLHAALLLVWIGVGVGYCLARAREPAGPAPPRDWPGSAPTSGSPALLAGAAPASASHWPGARPMLGLLVGSNRALGVAFWLAVVVAAVGLDAAARRSSGRVPTAEQLVRWMSRPVSARVVMVVAWTFAGWHLFSH